MKTIAVKKPLLLLLMLAAITEALAADAPRYNVLFIVADDLRPAMGCYGDAQAKTPNLEAAFKQFDDSDRMDFLTHYYAGVTQTDAQVGRLMAAMDRLKLWDKTVVIFIGDHGYHLGERGWWNKNTLFERSCRAPFLVIAPGVKPAVCRSLVEFLDIYPTVAGLCGLPAPATVKGKNLQPLLAEPSKKLHDSALTHIVRGGGMTGFSRRTERWRYIEWSDGNAELYDHDNDPGEWHNVAAEPANAAALAGLKRQLAARR